MDIKKITIFLVTTITGFFIGKWISLFITWLAPQYFSIDPGFLSNWFSKKPTLSSSGLGYVIYATTALVMFTVSNILSSLISSKK